MMSVLASALNWYQKKIGTYDKQSWEKTVDQRILRGVSAVPKKLARIKTELIDVDLVRGSAFPKAKPQHTWIAATLSGIIRVLFMPLYFRWWQLQTDILVACMFLMLYFLQIAALYLFYSATDDEFMDVPISEAVMPVAMLLILGVLHSQIVATFSSKSSRKRVAKTKRKRAKRRSRTKMSLCYDTKSSPDTASDDKAKSESGCSRPLQSQDSCGDHHSTDCQLSCGNRAHTTESERVSTNKLSDDESGLDVADTVQSTENDAPIGLSSTDKCKVHHDSGCILEKHDHFYCCCLRCGHRCLLSEMPVEKNNLELKSNKNADCENASSGEEFFVAKKPSYSTEEWKSYLLEMKSNKHMEKQCSVVKNCSKMHNAFIPRRYSDVGPVRSTSKKSRYATQRHSEEGIFTSFTDPCQANCQKEMENSRQQTNMLIGAGCLPNGLRCRKAAPRRLPLNIANNCSSCDSGPDTASANTPVKPQTSEFDWPLITNTDCNSYSSDSSPQSSQDEEDAGSDLAHSENPFAWEMQETVTPSVSVICPGSDKGFQTRTVSCTIWERNECKKVDLSVLDISSAIIRKVDSTTHSTEYLAVGVLFAVVISFLPLLFRLQSGTAIDTIQDVTLDVINFTVPSSDDVLHVIQDVVDVMLGSTWRVRSVVLITVVERFILSLAYFFLLSVAEKTFKQRFLYAKHFCYLTSSRRARRTDLPHFRLNKVRNIKTWLSVRSYLKKLGPQRSVDVIVSVAFILEVCVLSFLCVQLLKETGQFASKLHCWETLFWTLALGFFLLRFMIIGSKINKKYRNLSVLITEQINLYLHMEQKPHKKDELMLANSVLKLAADLLKELESPFKISGLCANPYLYNITKVVVLSAFSAVLTEVLGFKLKLYKIKIK